MTADDDRPAFWRKAQENLASAQSEYVNGRYNVCATRCYYAAFHAAEDPDGIYLRATVDIEESSDALIPALNKLHELEVEQGLPIYVVTDQPAARVAAQLNAQATEARPSLFHLPTSPVALSVNIDDGPCTKAAAWPCQRPPPAKGYHEHQNSASPAAVNPNIGGVVEVLMVCYARVGTRVCATT